MLVQAPCKLLIILLYSTLTHKVVISASNSCCRTDKSKQLCTKAVSHHSGTFRDCLSSTDLGASVVAALCTAASSVARLWLLTLASNVSTHHDKLSWGLIRMWYADQVQFATPGALWRVFSATERGLQSIVPASVVATATA